MPLLQSTTTVTDTIMSVFNDFADTIINSFPQILAGLLFITLAALAIKTITYTFRRALKQIYPENQYLIVKLIVLIANIVLWFGASLAFLDIVGLGAIAVSIGSATGFIGLGVTYALKDMLADTVAGVYLLQDPNFNEGDTVETASVTGTVETIDLRKTRIREPDNDLVVVANGDVEKRWTQTTPQKLTET